MRGGLAAAVVATLAAAAPIARPAALRAQAPAPAPAPAPNSVPNVPTPNVPVLGAPPVGVPPAAGVPAPAPVPPGVPSPVPPVTLPVPVPPAATPTPMPTPAVMPVVVPAAAPAAVAAPYRPPALALVHPAPGAAVPADRPVVGLRFAAGEPGDPVDPASFTLTVDGRDRTAAFQVSAGAGAPSGYPLGAYPPGVYSLGAGAAAALGEAWGALADPEGGGRAALKAGPHRVRARVCSARGVCASLDATVAAAADPAAPTQSGGLLSKPRRVAGVVAGALLELGRRLVAP